MNIQLVTVTPELAAQWLATNTTTNRKISQPTVNGYAHDMIRGKWQVTGETIKFDTDGRLIDGQHRLTAVVVSHRTVQMFVATGIPTEAMSVLDTGRTRSAGDAPTIIARQDKRPLQLVSAITEGPDHAADQPGDSPMAARIRAFMRAHALADIRMRMFKIMEYKLITGFPADYILKGNKAQQKEMIGNAVPVDIVRAFAETLHDIILETLAQAA